MTRIALPVPGAFRVFDAMFRPWMHRRIAGIHITGLPLAHISNRPLILVSNHVSWWDGFLLREVHRQLRPTAHMHAVMLERELRQRPLLRLLGAVGIDPGSAPSVLRTLRVLRERLERHPDSVVLYFPQGKIWPSHVRPLGFQRGVELFARHLPSADIIPIGIHLEPLKGPSPHAFISAGGLIGARSSTVADLEHAVELQLDAILSFLGEYGENAAEAWPTMNGFLPTRRVPGAAFSLHKP